MVSDSAKEQPPCMVVGEPLSVYLITTRLMPPHGAVSPVEVWKEGHRAPTGWDKIWVRP